MSSLNPSSFCVDVLVWEHHLAHPNSTTFLPQATLMAQRIALAIAPFGGKLFDDPYETCEGAMLTPVYGPELGPLLDAIRSVVQTFPSWTRVLLDFQTSPPYSAQSHANPREHLYLWLEPSPIAPGTSFVVLRTPFEGYFNENFSEEISCLLADEAKLAALGLTIRAWRCRSEEFCEVWLENTDIESVTSLLPRLPNLSSNIGRELLNPEPIAAPDLLNGRFPL